MIDQRIGKIKVRRGTEIQRVSNTFEEGELIYSVDKKRIFIGDDVTLGGVPVSNRNYISDGLGIPPIVPNEVMAGDIVFDKSNLRTYITNWNGTEYELLLIGDSNCCLQLQLQIDDLYTKLISMTGCLAQPHLPPPPPSKLNWAIQPTDNYVNIGDTVTFTTSAVGDGNISYVWRRTDGLTLNTPNIFKNIITITNVNIPDIATYYCIASNEVDSITSVNVSLDIETNSILAEDGTRIMSELNEFILWEENVVGLIIIKQPVSISTTAGTSVTFSIDAIGTPPITYQWRIAGIDLLGETNSTYTITNPTVDINSISCKVSNPAGDVISNSVNLTINKVNIIIKSIFAGANHSLAVGIDGTLSAWGYNKYGQIGDGTTTNRTTPIKINLPPVSMVAASNHSLAVGIDGTLSAWGYNKYGQIGDGTNINRTTPIKINLPPVSMVAVNESHSLAVGIDGTLSAWGDNTYGQIGDGTNINRTTPIKINLPPVSMVAAGVRYSLAVGVDGTLSAWGWNADGQLGDGTYTNRSTPIKINLPPVSTATADNATLVIGTDGTLSAWGNGGGGEFANGTITYRNTPLKINVPSVKMVSNRAKSILAVGTDGTLSAWGWNDYGQIGNGTITEIISEETLRPVKINLPSVSMVAAGYFHSLAVGTDGTLSAWGNNFEGRLGDGTTTQRLTPVKIF